MRINTNISAMNTYGRLTNANASKSESLSKLSSGLRINKAGDDAAGLAISEKMKGQVGGLTQAVRNAQDGVSLIQTAEGALNETHAILGRMRDLATQGANGTLSQDDRAEINKEFDALKTEITRISDTTEFNTKKLLNQDGQNFTFQIGANGGQTMSVKIGKMDADSLGITKDVTLADNDTVRAEAITTAEEALTDAKNKVGTTVASDLSTAQGALDTIVTAQGSDLDSVAATGSHNAAIPEYTDVNGNVVAANGTPTWGDVKAKATDDIAKAQAAFDEFDNSTAIKAAETAYNQAVNAVDTQGRTNASDAIASIDAAIKDVSAQRSDLGAAQNRLSHTVKNLTTTKENLAEANSRIRDVDMAEEMMSFTKSNILSQAATSMLSQANAMPNSVLGLLQG